MLVNEVLETFYEDLSLGDLLHGKSTSPGHGRSFYEPPMFSVLCDPVYLLYYACPVFRLTSRERVTSGLSFTWFVSIEEQR